MDSIKTFVSLNELFDDAEIVQEFGTWVEVDLVTGSDSDDDHDDDHDSGGNN